MKNLFLSAAFVLASLSTFATTTNLNNEIVETVIINEGFKEISIDQVPEPVKKAVAKDYAGATISKAFVNEKKEYKLELTQGGDTLKVYADAEGNWLKM